MSNDVMDDDGLPISEVGEWTLEKHERLRRYLDISRAVRSKFVPAGSPGHAGATYIDLYSGPGRSRVRESNDIVDGGALVACKTASSGGAPFSDIYVADIDAGYVDATVKRLTNSLGIVHHYIGPASETVTDVVKQLNEYALHFAFLDPFNLEDLPFSVIASLSHLKRMDMLIHVSVQDLQRNLGRYLAQTNACPLDSFAPGWRTNIEEHRSQEIVRGQILSHWLNLIRNLGMSPSQGIELVTGSKNQRLYWLVLVARHKQAETFWEKIRNISPQGAFQI